MKRSPSMICLDCSNTAPLNDACRCPSCGSDALFNAALMRQFGVTKTPQKVAQNG